MTAKRRTSFGRQLISHRIFFHGPLLAILTAVIVSLPFLFTALYAGFDAGNLLSLLAYFQERILPLWVLVATGLVWADLDPPHRPLALGWPVPRWRLLGVRTAAVLVPYVCLTLLSAWGLPRLYVQAVDVPLDTLKFEDFGFPILFSRALAVGLFYVGIVSVAGAAGRRWIGLTVAGVVVLLSAMGSMLGSVAGGAFYLFAWSGGSVHNLGHVTANNALVGCAGLAAALGALSGGESRRRATQGYRQVMRQFSLLRSAAVLLGTAVILAMPPLILLWFRRGFFDAGDLIHAFQYWHERFLPLLVVTVAGALWSDLSGSHRVIVAAWPPACGVWAVTKAVAAAVFYVPLAAVAAWVTPAILRMTLGVEAAVLPGGLLLMRSLSAAALLFGVVSLAGCTGSAGVGVVLCGILWMLNFLDRGWLSSWLGGALDLFAWSRGSEGFPWAETRRMLLAAVVLVAVAAAVQDNHTGRVLPGTPSRPRCGAILRRRSSCSASNLQGLRSQHEK